MVHLNPITSQRPPAPNTTTLVGGLQRVGCGGPSQLHPQRLLCVNIAQGRSIKTELTSPIKPAPSAQLHVVKMVSTIHSLISPKTWELAALTLFFVTRFTCTRILLVPVSLSQLYCSAGPHYPQFSSLLPGARPHTH